MINDLNAFPIYIIFHRLFNFKTASPIAHFQLLLILLTFLAKKQVIKVIVYAILIVK